MQLELAPLFFHASGEIMLATIALNLVYPVAAFLFILLYKNFMLRPSERGRTLRRGGAIVITACFRADPKYCRDGTKNCVNSKGMAEGCDSLAGGL